LQQWFGVSELVLAVAVVVVNIAVAVVGYTLAAEKWTVGKYVCPKGITLEPFAVLLPLSSDRHL
jgi:hypothetical protein